MSNEEIGSVVIVFLILLASAHLFGYIFSRLRQPKVIGEILAGIVLGPTMLGGIAPSFSSALGLGTNSPNHHTVNVVLSFVYWLGLLLLMFVSGAETRKLLGAEDRRQVAWLAAVGTLLPFLIAILLVPFLPIQHMMGPASQTTALILVLGIAVAVTSIPVISRIFHDLKILHTRFARIVLGVAVLEDIALWGVLAVATALAKSSMLPGAQISRQVLITIVYFVVGLLLAPRLLRRLHISRWNILAATSPTGYLVAILFTFSAIAALLDVSLVFAAFLAGYGAANAREIYPDSFDSLSKVAFSFFIPIYFLIVGYRLDLQKDFSLLMFMVVLAGACIVKLLSAGLGARLAGFSGLDVWNLAIATNARGGPGIVLASAAYDAGIINAAGYTTLVLLAILTSQAAGAWLEYVLRKGWPLLSGDRVSPVQAQTAPEPRPA